MAAQHPSFKPRSHRQRRPGEHVASRPALRWPYLLWAVIVLALMGISFLAGWLVALGPVNQALQQLHRDIQAVQAHRPLILHPLNFWTGLAGFVLGMLVMAGGNRWLRAKSAPTPASISHPDEEPFDDNPSEAPVPAPE